MALCVCVPVALRECVPVTLCVCVPVALYECMPVALFGRLSVGGAPSVSRTLQGRAAELRGACVVALSTTCVLSQVTGRLQVPEGGERRGSRSQVWSRTQLRGQGSTGEATSHRLSAEGRSRM